MILAVGAAIVAAAAVFGVRTAMSEIESDMIVNANVEALARGETHGKAVCYSQIIYLEGASCIRCITCDYAEGIGTEKGGRCRW